MRGYGTYLGIRRTVLDRNCIQQRGRWVSTRVQELGTRSGVRSVEAYVVVHAICRADGVAILRMVKEIERINPELRVNPFGYMEVLRQRQIHCASRWPQAVAYRCVPDGAQLEPVHGVTVRVDPLEVLKAGVSARLSRHQVGPLSVSTIADAGGVIDIRNASNNWRKGVSTREGDDRRNSPRAQAIPDQPIHVLQSGQVLDHVGRENVRPVEGIQPVAISQIEGINNQISSSIADFQECIRVGFGVCVG